MKRNILIILSALLIGTILAILFFTHTFKTTAKEVNLVYCFQVGVFKNYDNALKKSMEYDYSTIIVDNDYYRVIIGITYNKKDIYLEYFKNNEINYYLKEIKINNNSFDLITKYDSLLTIDNVNIIRKESLNNTYEVQN